MLYFLERLLGLNYVRVQGDKLLLADLNDRHQVCVPVTDTQFRFVPAKDPPQPVSTVELLTPNGEGQFIQVGGGSMTLKHISGALVILEILMTAWLILAIVAVLLYAPFWLLGGLSKKRRRPAERTIRFWPLITVLSLIAIVVIFMLASDDLLMRMGNLTAWSAAFFLATVAFGIAALVSMLVLWRAPRQQIRKGVRWFSFAVIVPLFIAALYLTYWGVIGLRTWA
jgi:hypothetical protein